MPVLTPRRTTLVRLVTLGDLLLDVMVVPERPVERGTDVPGQLSFRRGGSAANTAAAFVRAGGSASLITSVGDDFWAARLVSSLRAEGVRVHTVRHKGASGRLAAIVDERAQRSFITERGAADHIKPSDLDSRWLAGAAAFHLPAYSLFSEPIGSTSLAAVALARAGGAFVSVDVSSRGPLLTFGIRKARSRFKALAPDALFANRDEAAAILQKRGRRAWPALLQLAPLVVVKDGQAGCRVLWRDAGHDSVQQVDVAAERVRALDSTGAGDAFSAGFLYSLLRSRTPVGDLDGPRLRRAALAGHRAAAEALQRRQPLLKLG